MHKIIGQLLDYVGFIIVMKHLLYCRY